MASSHTKLSRLRAVLRRGGVAMRDGIPPPPFELVVGAFVGGLAVAIGNAIAIEVAVPWPDSGLGLRLQHHLFGAMQVLGLAAAWGLLATVATGVLRRPRFLGWLGLGALSTFGMAWALTIHLERQADVALNGSIAWLLLPTYIVLCGLAIPLAHLLGSAFSRTHVTQGAALGLGIGGNVLSHLILRDDYPGVHAAVLWTAVALLGSTLAPLACRWLRTNGRRLGFLGAAGLLCAGALLWAPPNAVRLQLFRESGSVAAWVLARTLWSLPALSAEARPSRPPYAPPSEPEITRRPRSLRVKPVVVLVTVEALRADVLADGKYDAQLPNLVWFRDHGAYFPRAIAAGSQTSVNMTSLFTGKYFSQLRWAKHGQGRMRFIYAAGDATPRFPELLTAEGIGTSSFLGLIFMGSYYGIGRGFAEQNMVVSDRRHAMAVELMRPLFKRLQKIRAESHFVWIHLMEPHAPYDRGHLKAGTEWDRYISEVAEVDRWMGQLIRVMRSRFRRRGYVIITGDHGEAFGEHGTRQHSKTLYDELIRVPLLIWGPGLEARRFDEPAGHIDIGPTVMDLYRLGAPAGHMGASLLPLMLGQVDQLERPMLAEGRLRRALIRRDGLKVVEDTVRKTVEVFDLRSDAAESRNLFDVDRSRAQPAAAELRAFFDRHALQEEGYRPPFKR